MTTPRTPIPWTVESQGTRINICGINESGGEFQNDYVVTTMDFVSGPDEANAEFIVRAVNCHEELIKTIQTLANVKGDLTVVDGVVWGEGCVVANLREFLKAEGRDKNT